MSAYRRLTIEDRLEHLGATPEDGDAVILARKPAHQRGAESRAGSNDRAK
jgi:hypothetical protein